MSDLHQDIPPECITEIDHGAKTDPLLFCHPILERQFDRDGRVAEPSRQGLVGVARVRFTALGLEHIFDSRRKMMSATPRFSKPETDCQPKADTAKQQAQTEWRVFAKGVGERNDSKGCSERG